MSDVFISYEHGDHAFVHRLSEDLRHAGYSTWHDKRIAPGTRFDTVIVDNLLLCHCVIAVVSSAALQSTWAQFEWALGTRSGKEMLVLILDPEHVHPHDLPDYLRSIQVIQLHDHSTNEEVISALATMALPPRMWSELFEDGVDIYLPLEKFTKPRDKAVPDIEGVNLRAINAALDMQQRLLLSAGSLIKMVDPVGIRFLPDTGLALPPDRNHVLLGGPGGAPFVHTLLKKWSGVQQELHAGYRFVTDPRRYFITGPFLRAGDLGGAFGRRVARTGIEDVQERRAVQFYEYRDASAATAGRNYVVLYTGGFDHASTGLGKTIVLAAYNRHVLAGGIDFLLDRKANNRWFSQVQKCGPYTETLIQFEVNVGQSPVRLNVPEPRPFGAGQDH